MMREPESRDFVYFKVPVFCVDLSIHIVVLLLLLKYMPPIYTGNLTDVWPVAAMAGLLAIAFCLAISMVGFKLHLRGIKFKVVIRNVFVLSTLTYILYIALIALAYKVVPRHLIIFQYLSATTLTVVWHCLAMKCIRTLRRLGHNTRSVVIVGDDADIDMLCAELNEGDGLTGYRILGIFSDTIPSNLQIRYLGKIEDFFTWKNIHDAEEIYCALDSYENKDRISKVVRTCNDNFISLCFVPSLAAYPKRVMNLQKFGAVTIMHFREEPLNSLLSKLWKRSFDIVVSGAFLCTLFPLVVGFVWIGNKLTGNSGPLFFRQVRTGYNGRGFRIFKFRSMKVNADADRLQATKDDPRKTPFGDFLRKSSIDELPQFINVFMGDMSIIGPRPHMEYHTEIYSAMISDYMVRHLAKPGITGWAQINGCRGETKTTEEMANRVRHDIWYIEHWSVMLDVEIFFKTIWQVIPGQDKQAY